MSDMDRSVFEHIPQDLVLDGFWGEAGRLDPVRRSHEQLRLVWCSAIPDQVSGPSGQLPNRREHSGGADEGGDSRLNFLDGLSYG
jgi:hypothetical protein